VGLFSVTLKIAWIAWLSASLGLIVWRRYGRTAPLLRRSTRTAPSEQSTEKSPSKQRWRLRANSDSPVLRPQSTLGL
jgi:hypothetical protein